MDKSEMLPAGYEDEPEEVVEETQPEETDTETETVEPTDTETETVEEEAQPDAEGEEAKPSEEEQQAQRDYEAMLDELGLRGQFSSVEDALRRLPDYNNYTDTLQKQNAALRRILDAQVQKKEKPEQQLSREQLEELYTEDPVAAMKAAGFVSRDEIERQEQEIAALRERDYYNSLANTVSEISELKNVAAAYRLGRQPVPGVNQYWDTMNRLYTSNPGLHNADQTALIPILFNEAKRVLGDSVKRPPVQKISPDKKAGATSTSKGGSKAEVTPNFNKMTEQEIFDWYEKRGLVVD